jgi:hypothetical protein
VTDAAAATADAVGLTDRIGIGVLTRLLPRDLVDEVLAETGRREQRRRLLPARVVVYYVLALCLFFGDAYEEVMRKLVGGLQFLRCWHGDWAIPTPSALCQARQRLGEAPLQALFERVAVPMTEPGGLGWYRSWRVMAIDGVVLDAPDSPENVAAFGKWRNAIAASPFPQVRVVGLAECGSRAIVAARIEPCHTDEKSIARELIGDLDEGMLLLADRGFYGYEMWKLFRRSGAELVWRVQLKITLPVHEVLPDGSYLSSLAPRGMRSQIARGKSRRIDRYEIPVRVVDYTITNRSGGEPETIRLVTSILDHELAPAAELAALYHQRWEIELALDEIQTHQIGRPRVLRSRSPEMVRQEIWALLLTHYAIRHLMHEAADDAEVDLDRVSFMRSLRVIRRQVTDQAAFSPSPVDELDPNGLD